jgi:lipopolysaccharide transport system ATP-binding protein
MPQRIIEISHIGKKYRIGVHRGYLSLREQLVRKAKSLMPRVLSGRIGSKLEEFWALKDVSFSVNEGEAVGIIGRNGAGKSTLLKILSKITPPTEGKILLRGCVASLLEVGTGFHPELTGRENIYLNGAILGMTRSDIRKKFDEIVDFAEIEKFLDTPVKRYSSGMYVRLAFAVAAHLEPEILVVDEVLAVGDSQFQKKCLGKMGKVAKSGRTVLFVSHNMAAIEGLCSRALLLNEGRVIRYGPAKNTIDHYLGEVLPAAFEGVPLAEQSENRSGNGRIRLIGYRLEDEAGRTIFTVRSGMSFDIVMEYLCSAGTSSSETDVGISLSTLPGQQLVVFYSSHVGQTFIDLPRHGEFRCKIRRLPLGPNRYVVGARVTMGGVEADWPREGIGFLDVEAGDYYGTGAGVYHPNIPLLLEGSWSTIPAGEPAQCGK